jgi:hypothetical protein
MRIDRDKMCFSERIKMAFADTPVPVVIGSYRELPPLPAGLCNEYHGF